MQKRHRPTTVAQEPRTRIGNKHDILADGFIRLAPRTHDISLVGEHIPSIAHLASDLASAVKAGWSRRHEARYSQVEVLLLQWEDDDLGVESELIALRHVFEDLYGFGVQSYQIPSEKPDKALKRRVLDFLDLDRDETLLIVYYAGHAKGQANEAPFWIAHRALGSPSLPSAGIQSMFEEADSDVVLLYDCCNSAATTASSSRQSHKGVTEVIAACGYEAIAPEVGEHSFSNALTEILAAASKGKPFSIAELHTRILNRLKCWTPSFIKDENGNFTEDESGRLQYEQQPRRTPIYSIICETDPRRSIVLAPLRYRERSVSIAESGGQGSSDVGTCSGPPKSRILSNNHGDRGSKRKRPRDEKIEYPQVLLAIRLDKHELDIDAWKECLLRQLPAEAKDIKIEGIFGSFSTLLLLRLPVDTWNLLPENSAYSFVGFVTSENMVLKERKVDIGLAKLADITGMSKQMAGPLAMRSDKSRETTPFRESSPSFSFKNDVISPPSSADASRRGSTTSSSAAEVEIHQQSPVVNSLPYGQYKSCDPEVKRKHTRGDVGLTSGLRQSYAPENISSSSIRSKNALNKELSMNYHRYSDEVMSTGLKGQVNDEDMEQHEIPESSVMRSTESKFRAASDLQYNAETIEDLDNYSDLDHTPQSRLRYSVEMVNDVREKTSRLKLEDYDNEDDAASISARRRRSRRSSANGKRTHAESIGSESDEDDITIPFHLSASDVGSSARRLRRKTSFRASLIFDDPPDRIEELSEPESEYPKAHDGANTSLGEESDLGLDFLFDSSSTYQKHTKTGQDVRQDSIRPPENNKVLETQSGGHDLKTAESIQRVVLSIENNREMLL